jgi:hypothetical protein
MSAAHVVAAAFRGAAQMIRTLGNVLLGFAYLYACVYITLTAPPEQVKELGNLYLMLGIGVSGVVAGRVVQAIQEAKHVKGNGDTHA